MRDMFKGNVFMQDTHTQIMSSCKTLQFRKTCLLSLVGRHDLLKDMSSCLKMPFYCFYFLCFILLKTCLFPRHVLNMAPRHDFYSDLSTFRRCICQKVLCIKSQKTVKTTITEFGILENGKLATLILCYRYHCWWHWKPEVSPYIIWSLHTLFDKYFDPCKSYGPSHAKFCTLWQKMVSHFWQSVDVILEDVSVTETIVWCWIIFIN